MHDDSSPLKMGPVIGGTGDVNVTNVVNTEKDAECAKCGTHCTKGQFSTCQGCRKTFCNLHFNRDLGLCPFCESSKEKSSEAEFLSFLKRTVSDDNKITGPELLKLKKEGVRLGLETAEINRIIKDFQNKGLQGTIQDLIDSARRLYHSGKIREAGERLARFSEEQLLEQSELLDLHFKIQAILEPNKLIRFLEEWPVESVERYVAEFCIREDRVTARAILFALRDRKQEDLFSTERIQICWQLSELEETLQLAEREKLLEISRTLMDKAALALPAHQSVFQDLCDILDDSKEFTEQPNSVTKRSDRFEDSIAQRAAKICRQAWDKLSRTIATNSSLTKVSTEISSSKTALKTEFTPEDLWQELARVRQYQPPEDIRKTVCHIYLPDLKTKKSVHFSTVVGRNFFSDWGDEFIRFMAGEQFELIQVYNLNGELWPDIVKALKKWDISPRIWNGWVIAPCSGATNNTFVATNQSWLHGQPLTTPHPMIGPITVSLGKTNKCRIQVEWGPI